MIRHMNATEVQAEFYRQAVNSGLSVRLEMLCGVKHSQFGYRTCRFDCAITSETGKLRVIVECKGGPARNVGSNQVARYRLHGVPVFLAFEDNILDILSSIRV